MVAWAALMDKSKGSLGDIKVTFAIDIKSDRIRALSAKLGDLILKRKTLLFDYTDRHPQVLEANSQLDGLLDEIKKELSLALKRY